MIALNTAYGGPAIHKTERVNPTEVLVSLIDANPAASKEAHEKQFIEAMRDDDEYLTAVIKYYFTNAWTGLYHPRFKNNNGHTRQQRRAATEARTAEYIEKIKRATILDFILPNGKAVRDATFADCAKAGGKLARIAKLGKPSQIVGKVLSEKQAAAA